jgi:prophage maintenance system killer protein
MKISKKDLLRINKGFGGNLRSDSSLDFALEIQENKKLGHYKKLAYLMIAILVDHPFSDGNKRTAAVVALSFAEENNKKTYIELLQHHLVSIAKKNTTNIRDIEWRLKNAIR